MTSKSSRTLTGSSGSSTNDVFFVTVRLLEDDNSIVVYIPEAANGGWLLEEVCRLQEVLPEIEYFGLRYVSCELLSAPTKHWMNLNKPVRSQLKHTNPLVVSFRIKHYPPDPITEFKLDKSKYLLFHQIHRDFLSGRLIAPHNDIILLAALFIQVALGDASEMITTTSSDSNSLGSISTTSISSQSSTYLSNFRALHNTNKKYEPEILEQHRKLQ
nr:ferm domain containing protein [Hymenolepis microstoma]